MSACVWFDSYLLGEDMLPGDAEVEEEAPRLSFGGCCVGNSSSNPEESAI